LLLEKLREIAARLKEDNDVPPITVRTLLSWASSQRRGYWVVEWIRRCLREAGLTTDPDFESAYIDSLIRFVLAPADATALEQPDTLSASAALSATEGPLSATLSDPTYRISKLAAANNVPTYISPDSLLQEAVTLMLANDFSQLPVMTNERDVKGIISWTSIGTRLVLGRSGQHVRELMDAHQEIRAEASLFQAIPIIVQHSYVLVRAHDNRIIGIVTASDLSAQFQQLAEPFLLLGEIENHIRRILNGKFSSEELASVRDPSDMGREITEVSDLTFGEYIRLLENGDRWNKLAIAIDRATFCRQLDDVRRIRNDVMHFDPDGIPQSDLDRLRDFALFLQRLQSIGAT
jgi:CBS domain-containing protein